MERIRLPIGNTTGTVANTLIEAAVNPALALARAATGRREPGAFIYHDAMLLELVECDSISGSSSSSSSSSSSPTRCWMKVEWGDDGITHERFSEDDYHPGLFPHVVERMRFSSSNPPSLDKLETICDRTLRSDYNVASHNCLHFCEAILKAYDDDAVSRARRRSGLVGLF
jgi:hypothetical protein